MKNLKKFISFAFCAMILLSIQQSEASITYNDALNYQKQFPKEVYVYNKKEKDVYGKKNNHRHFVYLGTNGILNIGNGFNGSRTFINFGVDYGFEDIQSEPYAYITWFADLAGSPDKGYKPKFMNIAFTDGTVLKYDLQGWEYTFIKPILFGPVAHVYSGCIKFSDIDLYELSQHGNIIAISIDVGNGTIKNFFYSGDKQIKEKNMLNNGIKHAMKILEVNAESVEAHRKEQSEKEEAKRLADLRTQVEAEIKAEKEKEAMRQKILNELAEKEKTTNTY